MKIKIQGAEQNMELILLIIEIWEDRRNKKEKNFMLDEFDIFLQCKSELSRRNDDVDNVKKKKERESRS